MSKCASPRINSWHESKKLRKRAAFLLDNLDLIPADVCFRFTTEEGMAEEVHGHKIFFALASPVFYAMLYGPMKEEGDVEIEDVSVDAFRCLQKYIYTDSFDAVSVANAVDVLAASKKYLMAKLTRYCYGFIQKSITAENSISLWSQAQSVFDDVVADQCVSEIKRNTAKVVLTEGFLNMSQDQLLELTSWQNLTIKEFDLFQAIKKWKMFEEETTGSSLSSSRKVGEIFQNIRFALLTTEQLLADQFILDQVFSAEDVKEMFRHKTAGIQLSTFSPQIRQPAPSSFQLSITGNVYLRLDDVLPVSGSVEVLIWADVAPKACQVLRHCIEKSYDKTITVERFPDADVNSAGSLLVDWSLNSPMLPLSEHRELRKLSEENKAEKQSGLWPVDDSVLLSFKDGLPQLRILTNIRSPLRGQQPDIKERESIANGRSGIVVGKVLSFSPDFLRNLEVFERFKSKLEIYLTCGITDVKAEV